MKVIHARNVCEAYPLGLAHLREWGAREGSRAGDVIVAPTPVTTVYEKPTERVLFDPARDANPFFHLMEALFFLAGRADVGFLDHYIKDFGSRYAESDGALHDSYGRRWRSAFGHDQLAGIIQKLKTNPADRQIVLQMWDSHRELGVGENDLLGDWKSRPCNLVAAFRARNVLPSVTDQNSAEREAVISNSGQYALDLTVFCRSNDAIWGAYGANAVHMSVMLEYVASMADMRVGRYYQISNNFHAYVGVMEKMGEPELGGQHDEYLRLEMVSLPMVTAPQFFDKDLAAFMRWHDSGDHVSFPIVKNEWFCNTACRMVMANDLWRGKLIPVAIETAQQIQAPDWRRACVDWLKRRDKSAQPSEHGAREDRTGGGGR